MIFVGIGGFFGAVCRYLIGLWLTPKWTNRFPLTTWLINISGSFLLGMLANLDLQQSFTLLLMTGFLGAYTTFSTFGFEVIQLIEDRLYKHAFAYVVSSLLLGILFVTLGWHARSFFE